MFRHNCNSKIPMVQLRLWIFAFILLSLRTFVFKTWFCLFILRWIFSQYALPYFFNIKIYIVQTSTNQIFWKLQSNLFSMLSFIGRQAGLSRATLAFSFEFSSNFPLRTLRSSLHLNLGKIQPVLADIFNF